MKPFNLCLIPRRTYKSKSVYKVYRKTDNGWKVLDNKSNEINTVAAVPNQTHSVEIKEDETQKSQQTCRENEMKIQMLSKSLFDQIFKGEKKQKTDTQTIQR